MVSVQLNKYQKIVADEYSLKIINNDNKYGFGVVSILPNIQVRIGIPLELFLTCLSNCTSYVSISDAFNTGNMTCYTVSKFNGKANKKLGLLLVKNGVIVGYKYEFNGEDDDDLTPVLGRVEIKGEPEIAASILKDIMATYIGRKYEDNIKTVASDKCIKASYNDFMLYNGKYDLEYSAYKLKNGNYKLWIIGYNI